MKYIDENVLSLRVGGDETIRIDKKEFSEYTFEDASSALSMFGNKKIIILADIMDKKSLQEKVLENAQEMLSSGNIFVVHEKKILKPILTKLEKVGAEIHTIKKEAIGKRVAYSDEPFNLFLLTDALGNKDRQKLWLLYTEAIQKGAPVEEIHGLFNWQVKNMLMVSISKENPGMHPFVYKKTLSFAKKFTPQELKEISSKLVQVFHDREMGIPLEVKLEQFVLGL